LMATASGHEIAVTDDSAPERRALYRLAWDATVGILAQRQLLSQAPAADNPVHFRTQDGEFDLKPLTERIKDFLPRIG